METQQQPVAAHGGKTAGFIALGVGMLVLTVAAVLMIGLGVAKVWIITILLALALAQVLGQVFLFMHLNVAQRILAYIFMAGMALATLMAVALMLLPQQWA